VNVARSHAASGMSHETCDSKLRVAKIAGYGSEGVAKNVRRNAVQFGSSADTVQHPATVDCRGKVGTGIGTGPQVKSGDRW
jgi:hypothetical protein